MSRPTCIYCGNNPVPHKIYWYNESLNILLTPIRHGLLYNPLSKFFKKHNWDKKVNFFLLSLAESLRFITRQKDVAKCKVRRAQALWEEAVKRGMVMEELLLFGKPFDSYVVREVRGKSEEARGGQIIFSGLPRPEGYINPQLDLMDDKEFFKKFMQEKDLPVPRGASATSYSQAVQIFRTLLKPVIVKPRAGSRGRHTTTFVTDEQQLKKAVAVAKQLCYWVVIEEHIIGPVYRATVINGKLAGVLRGDAPKVTGDGIATIKQLVNKKNSTKPMGVKDIVLDIRAEQFLARQGLLFLSVLPAGVTVSLSEKIGVSYGGSSSEDYEICHPDNKELFVRAAAALDVPIVGFDFIIPDITKSFRVQRCGFIEANSLPFINLHHDPLLGTPRNAAALVWDMLGM